MKFTKRNLKAICCMLVAGAIGQATSSYIRKTIQDYENERRTDVIRRIGRTKARNKTRGFRSDGILWDDDEDNWLVKTIDV